MSTEEPSAEVVLHVSGDAKAVIKRYLTEYEAAGTTISIGFGIKVFGAILGGLIALGSLVSASRSGLVLVGLASAISTFAIFYIAGHIVETLGRINRACLDTAVHSSPFLDDDLKSRTLQLGTRPKAKILT